MPTRTSGRESHRQLLQDARAPSGARVHRWCRHVANPLAPAYGELALQRMTSGLITLRRPRVIPDPQRYVDKAAELEAEATALGLEVDDLLCIGCVRLRARLVAEGLWPA